ncbi:MAG: L-serine ammonia-lyase, iron-sulfur-dependent, subunit alpha, partial [Chloroflexi bacterium]|nr:L-serine ammonia-lyase, iron-sulfur-dependent, subunit alpha [Chloroflexota bacterium]
TGLVSAYALAVMEENGSAGVVVTAPTCGACGAVPAVLKRVQESTGCGDRDVLHALATAGIVGNLVKTRPTRPQKEMTNLAQKQANVRGAFAVRGQLTGEHLLVLDDLFDSGATLTEITRVLRAASVEVYVATLTKTIHTDA